MALAEPPQPDAGGGGASRIAARAVLAVGALLITVGIAIAILFGFSGSGATWYLFILWGLLLLIVYGFLEPETVRAFFGQGQLRAGVKSMITTLLVLAAVVIVNVVVKDRLASYQLDVSKGRVNSLSAQTQTVLKQVNQPLTATAWYAQSSTEVASGYTLLQRYRDINHNVTVQRLSSQDRPDLFKSQGASTPSVVFQYGKKQPKVVTDMSEQGLTTALIELVAGHSVKVYFLAGHGEGPIDTTSTNASSYAVLKQNLSNQGITAVSLHLGASATPGQLNPSASPSAAASPSPSPAETPSPAASASPSASPAAGSVQVPSDADAVAVLDPQLPLSDVEVAALQAYLAKGGRLLVSNLRFTSTNVGSVLSKTGLKFGNGVVLDPNMRLSANGSPAVLAVTQYGNSPVTSQLGNEPTILELMGSVQGTAATGYTETPLVSTQSDACERTDQNNQSVQCADSDTKGPFTLIATVEQSTTTSKPARLVVMGGADWMSDSALNQLTAQQVHGNSDLSTAMMLWLVGQEKVISIPPRQPSPSTVFLSDAQRALVFPGFFLFGPALIALIGFWVWYRTRD